MQKQVAKIITQKQGPYIDRSTLLQCFRPGEITHVDKIECGNGFTTAFLNNEPPEDKVNILIAPNKAVVIGKEQDYLIKNVSGVRTIPTKFFYKSSQDFNFEGAKILVFVADSFLIYKRSLKAIKDRINFVLIDEYHSTQTQSVYRSKLVNFINSVKNIVGVHTAVTTITATPLLFSHIDIKIKLLERQKEKRSVTISNNERAAIDRIKTLLANNEKVVLFTNSIKIIQKFIDNGKLEVNLKVGNTLLGDIVEMCQITNNSRSNFYICSSRGFEGFDIYGEDFNVFFFEDRSRKHTTFYASNLYQALNRCRDGFKYAEYVRLELSKNRSLYLNNNRVEDINQLDKKIQRFINRKDISTEQKQRNAFKDYNEFIIYTKNDNGTFNIEVNESRINLEKELHLYDNQNFWNSEFYQFFEDRNVNFIDARHKVFRVNKRNTPEGVKRDFLKVNNRFIETNDLFGKDYFLIPIRTDNSEKALKNVTKYLRRKNYNGNYTRSHTQLMILCYLTRPNEFKELLRLIVLSYANKQHQNHPKREAEVKIKEFREKAQSILLEFLQCFVNDNLYFKKNIVGHRDYNILVEVGISQIRIICDAIGVGFTEVDVRNCFPRILYAINDLELPVNFYGVNKENKTKINVLINNFMYQPKLTTPLKIQKVRGKQNLLKVGIDPKVTEFLINHFFKARFRGDLFNYLSYFESELLQKLKNELRDCNIKSIFRRHDSLIIFDSHFDKEKHVREFEFLGQKNWFLEPLKEPEKQLENELVF